jgi:hypothetical protein
LNAGAFSRHQKEIAVGNRVLRWILPVVVFSLVGIGGALAAPAANTAATKVTPTCKSGQKSTKGHPCVKKTAKAKVKVTAMPQSTTTTTTTAQTPASAPATNCPQNGANPGMMFGAPGPATTACN